MTKETQVYKGRNFASAVRFIFIPIFVKVVLSLKPRLLLPYSC